MEGALASHILKNTNFQINQHCFLQKHDRKTKKLWFLWPQAVTKVSVYYSPLPPFVNHFSFKMLGAHMLAF